MSDQHSFAWFDAPPEPTDGLFFAIFPAMAAAASMTRLTCRLRDDHGLRGTPLATERLHVSLLSLGEHTGLPESIVAVASEAAATVAALPFDVAFDRVMTFRGKRPLVLRGGDGIAALMAFQGVLGAVMTKAGFGRSSRSRFTPHVTLTYVDRDVAEQAVEPVRWTVREFVLVHSLLRKSQYIPLGRWPLRGRI
jgi:RNA 2',3'-cyclic 3'-phosphodiesterase